MQLHFFHTWFLDELCGKKDDLDLKVEKVLEIKKTSSFFLFEKISRPFFIFQDSVINSRAFDFSWALAYCKFYYQLKQRNG